MHAASSRSLQPEAFLRPALQITPTAGALGALIEGVDLTTALDPVTFEAVRQALNTHKVIFFRKQPITLERQRAFAARFGQIQAHPMYPHPEYPDVAVLEHTAGRPSKIGEWHTDMTFTERPPLGSVLRGVSMPTRGGDTVWSDQGAAFQALSSHWQRFISGLEAVHDFRQGFRHSLAEPGAQERFAGAIAANPPVTHPVVRTHPETGEQGLFVNELFTSHIVGMSEKESRSVLDFLYAHSVREEFTCRFRWEDDSIAMWDNRITQHRPVNDHGGQYRLLYRVTVEGDRPC